MTNIDLERLKEKAIEEAVSGRYENAISLNLEILKADTQDIDSMMQLAHAYWQTGDLASAKKYYRKALEIEPNNNLAKKRLSLLSSLNETTPKNSEKRQKARVITITDLIEEPGKTKIVRLSNIGKPEHLGMLKIGEELFMRIRKRRLEVRDIEANFIGCLPDDISKRLIEFIGEKAEFEAFVFSIDRNEVKVFVKEISKPNKFKHVSSFVSEDIIPTLEDDDEEEEGAPVIPAEEGDIDMDADKILLTPEEIEASRNKETEDEDDEEEEEPDKETYREFEE